MKENKIILCDLCGTEIPIVDKVLHNGLCVKCFIKECEEMNK